MCHLVGKATHTCIDCKGHCKGHLVGKLTDVLIVRDMMCGGKKWPPIERKRELKLSHKSILLILLPSLASLENGLGNLTEKVLIILLVGCCFFLKATKPHFIFFSMVSVRGGRKPATSIALFITLDYKIATEPRCLSYHVPNVKPKSIAPLILPRLRKP